MDELLFRGYTPGVLNQFTMIISLLTQIIPASLLPPMPDMLLEGKFGLWYGKNNSMKDAYWTINTGDRYMDEYAQVMKYNGEEELPERWWPRMGPSPSAHRGGYGGMCHGEENNMLTADDVIELIAEIHGTDGQQFHPLMHDEEDGLWLFVPDLCRSLRAKYFGDEKVNGIDTKHYEAAEDLFDLESAQNLCYCHGVESCATEVEGEDAWDLSSCPQCSLGLMNSQGCQVILVSHWSIL